jgi:hypothetical protein
MFFYYQVRTHHHQTEAVPQLTCPVCHTTGHLQMSIMQKYMWVLGPIAPSGKYAVAFCEHCNNYIPKVRWTDEMDSAYQRLKQGIKTPGRLYRGLIVFPLAMALIIGAVMLYVKTSNNKKEDNQALIKEAIKNPQKGDIFQITQSDGTHTNYTYFKVASSRGDSIYFNPSKVHITDMKKMKEWDEIPVAADAYETTQIGFSISQSQAADMFTYATQPAQYGMVWSLYRNGTLYKKY